MSLFVDKATVRVTSGRGGDGCVGFRQEKYVQHGGPWGGDGGKGGDVVFEATHDLQTLLDFQLRRHYEADDGQPGGQKNRSGRMGGDRVVRVPCGTVIRDAESGRVMVDLADPGDRWVAAQGGRGGRGNAAFATPVHRAPTHSEPGGPAITRELILELKLLADVGLVGLPNAGKSTLISAVSAARPKIADYPFTTLQPQLGVVRFEDGGTMILADIPGLIEGAHEGAGLGHAFLRHVERTRLLIHVLDLSGGMEGRDPLADWHTIEHELEAYSPELAARPRVAFLNKCDLPEARDQEARVREALEAKGLVVVAGSAATRQGLQPLLDHLRKTLPTLPEPTRFLPEELPEKPVEAPFTIQKTREGYEVTGPTAERLLTNFDPENPETIHRFERGLKGSGIYDALRDLGVKDGDTVQVADLAFTWVD